MEQLIGKTLDIGKNVVWVWRVEYEIESFFWMNLLRCKDIILICKMNFYQSLQIFSK